MRKTFITAAVGGSVLAASLLVAPMAIADSNGHGNGHAYGLEKNLRTRGVCTVSSEYKGELQNKRDGQRLKFQVKTATAGEEWQLVVTADGVALAPQTATSVMEDDAEADETNVAEVEWKQNLNPAATEVSFLATNTITNESCTAKLTASTLPAPLPPKPPVVDPIADPVTEPTPTVSVASTTGVIASRKITRTVVATHNTASDCWAIIKKNVYDLTSYVSQHPGGSAAIEGICGTDATATFKSQHGGSGKVATTLASFKIGRVKR